VYHILYNTILTFTPYIEAIDEKIKQLEKQSKLNDEQLEIILNKQMKIK
jgi:hypothetical protein